MLVNREHSPATMKAEVSLSDGDSPHVHPKASMWKKNKSKNKRKFSDEQIRLLESMFEAESRPELQIKQQLANELGLQPRQVAIWFQNKRARSKSKLVEQEYSNLKRNYDTLASKYDSLKTENQRLLTQLQRLRKLMGKPQESWNRVLGQTGISVDKESDNKDTTNSEAEKKTNSLLDCHNHEIQMPSLCDDGNENVEYFVEEIGILNMEELVPDRSSLTSSGNWCSFEAGFELSCVLDRPSCSSECWEL